MPNTTNLNLYKYNGATDGNNTFNIDVALNDNWDKIDADSKTKADSIQTLTSQVGDNALQSLSINNPITSLPNVVDGLIQVDSITGRTYKNLLGDIGNCEDISKWTTQGNITLDSTIKLFSSNSFKFISNNTNASIIKDILCDQTHKYFVSAYCYISSNTTGNVILTVRDYGANTNPTVATFDNTKLNQWQRKSVVVTGKAGGGLRLYTGDTTSTGINTFNLDGIMVYDLTEIFGAGKEPSDINLLEQLLPYISGIKSVGEAENNKISITSTATSKQDKLDIQLKEPFRSLTSGILDEIIGNKLIKRIGKVVLNGSETWNIGTSLTNTIYFYTSIVNKKVGISNLITDNFICFANKDIYTVDEENIVGGGGNTNVVIRVLKSKLTPLDVSGFKTYLSNNPLSVYYELATQVEEEIQVPSLKCFKNGSIQLNNIITPTITFKYPTNINSRLQTSESELDRAFDAIANKVANTDLDPKTTGGNATAYTVTLNNPNLNQLIIVPHVDCGATPTLSINGTTALTIVKQDGSAIASGEIKANKPLSLVRVGSNFFIRSGVINMIKRMQKGTTQIGAGALNASVSISAVDISKAVLIMTSANPGSTPSEHAVMGVITSSTNIDFTRHTANGVVDIEWQVIEFNNTKSVQMGTINGGSQAFYTSEYIVNVASVDVNKCLLFFSWNANDNSSTMHNIKARAINSTSIGFKTNNSSSGGINNLRWYLVEFN